MKNDFKNTFKDYTADVLESNNKSIIKQYYFDPKIDDINRYYSGFVYQDYYSFFNEELPTIPSGTCIPFTRKIFVTSNGKILPCETIMQSFALGEISSNAIDIDFKKISDIYNTYFDLIENQCKNCSLIFSCKECIFCNVNLVENKILKCNKYKSNNYLSDYFKSVFSYIECNNNVSKIDNILKKDDR